MDRQKDTGVEAILEQLIEYGANDIATVFVKYPSSRSVLLSVVGVPPHDANYGLGGRLLISTSCSWRHEGHPTHHLNKLSDFSGPLQMGLSAIPLFRRGGCRSLWSFHACTKSFAEAGLCDVAQNAVPDFHIASSMVASLRATATIAFFSDVYFEDVNGQSEFELIEIILDQVFNCPQIERKAWEAVGIPESATRR